MKKKVFIVCVDRDNDLGRKAKVHGPVVGKKNNIEAASKLALKDPAESDANTIFAAVKKLEEAKKEFPNAEVVTITGAGKLGLKSDKEINSQIEKLKKNYLIEGWILVTDGAEDSRVVPILQSTAKILSTEEVIVKQAQVVESTFYTIKEALKDPGISRLMFGIPGIILVMAGVLFTLGFQALQPIALVVGVYLLFKGFGIEEKILEFFSGISSSFLEQRGSLPLYLGGIGFFLFGLVAGYNEFITYGSPDIFSAVSSLRAVYPFLALGAILFVMGKGIDCLHRKKAYNLGKYLISGISLLLLWAIIDAGTLVFLRQASIDWFLINIVVSLVLLVIAIRSGKIFDIRDKITRLLIGLNVFDAEGNFLGKVKRINRKKQSIIFSGEKNKEYEKTRKEFELKGGRVIVTS